MVVVGVGVGVASDVGEVEVGNSLIETVFVKHFDVSKQALFSFVCQFSDYKNKLSYDFMIFFHKFSNC